MTPAPGWNDGVSFHTLAERELPRSSDSPSIPTRNPQIFARTGAAAWRVRGAPATAGSGRPAGGQSPSAKGHRRRADNKGSTQPRQRQPPTEAARRGREAPAGSPKLQLKRRSPATGPSYRFPPPPGPPAPPHRVARPLPAFPPHPQLPLRATVISSGQVVRIVVFIPCPDSDSVDRPLRYPRPELPGDELASLPKKTPVIIIPNSECIKVD